MGQFFVDLFRLGVIDTFSAPWYNLYNRLYIIIEKRGDFHAAGHSDGLRRAGRTYQPSPENGMACDPDHSEVLQSYGVNMYQAMSLIYIAWYSRTESVNQRSIEKYLYLSNPGVSKIISFLENSGYVRRDPDPKDARSYLLSATESGQEFATVLNQAILESDDRIMAPLSAAERKTMMNLLAKIGES